MCRIGETQAVANLIKNLVFSVYQEGGVVRQVYNLGDRISDKSYVAKDGSKNTILRYLCVEFDANPDTKSVAEKVAKQNTESVHVFVHKLKDTDYYKRIFDKENWKYYASDVDTSQFKEEMINILAKEKINLGDKFDQTFDKMKNKLI
jgi:hypothetical protein